MKKIELVYRELLYQAIEKQNRITTQLSLAKKLKISLSTVNHALKPLKRMNSVKVENMNLKITDPKKILFYWASIRDIEKDIIYQTRVNLPAAKIESDMPSETIFSAYSAYKFIFKDVPADYSEVYVYGNGLIKRFKTEKGHSNLFVLKKDSIMDSYKNITFAQIFVDLWNIKTWYAKEFLKSLEEKINERILE